MSEDLTSRGHGLRGGSRGKISDSCLSGVQCIDTGTALELGTRETDISLAAWQELSVEFAIASEGMFDQNFYTAVMNQACNLDPCDLHPSTISQAVSYAQKIDMVPDLRMIRYYGYLREGFFAWPVAGREHALQLHGLCDQKMFAITLLLCGERDGFYEHILHYPNIFDEHT